MITSTILDIITILSFGVSIFALIITINIYLIQQQRSDDAILENLTVEFLTEFIINFKRLNLELGNLVRRKEIGTTDDLLKRIKKYPLNWNFTYWLSHRGIILGILLKKGKGIEEFRSVLLFTKEAAAFKKNIEEMNQKIEEANSKGISSINDFATQYSTDKDDLLVNANKALEKMELTIDNLNNVLEIEKNYELLKDLYLQADS